MHRRLLASTAAVALLLGLAACADEPAPPRPPSINIQMPSDGGGEEAAPSDGGGEDGGDEAEPTTEEHAIPEPDPADFPGMDEHTPEGAEQAGRYFVAHIVWGYQTGQTETYRQLFTDECESCLSNANSMEKAAADGKLWPNSGYNEESIKREDPSDSGKVIIEQYIIIDDSLGQLNTGDSTDTSDAHRLGFRTGLIWDGTRWLVQGMGQQGWEVR